MDFLEAKVMDGPGQYVADPTEGITRVEDLPPPQILKRSRNYRRRPCPRCGHRAYRLRTSRRTLHDLGDPLSGRPRTLEVTYSEHRCPACNCYFTADLLDLALPNAHYTLRVMHAAVRLVVEDGLPYRTASWHLWRDHRVFVPFATIQNWVEAGGKKGRTVRRH
jgi:transposase